MDKLAFLLGPVGCVIGMVVCVAVMARGKRKRPAEPDTLRSDEVAALRAEVEKLRRERPPVDG